MASRGNQHCANCIGALSFPIIRLHRTPAVQRCSLLLQLECDLSMCLSVADTELSPTRKNEVIMDGATCGVVCGLGWARKRIVLVGGYPMERCKTGRTPPTTLQSRGDIWPEWTLQKRMSDQSAICDVDSGGPKSPSGITRNSGAPDKYRSRALPPLYTTCVCVRAREPAHACVWATDLYQQFRCLIISAASGKSEWWLSFIVGRVNTNSSFKQLLYNRLVSSVAGIH